MRWVLIAAVVVAAIGGLVALVGYRLPQSHEVRREATFRATPESVWAAITDVEAFPSWRADVKTVVRLPDRAGQPVWREEGRSGKITLAVERAEPPRVLILRIADDALPFGGTWTYEIRPATDGATLAITEKGEIYNPMFRFMARFVFGYEGTIAGYLTALDGRLNGARS